MSEPERACPLLQSPASVQQVHRGSQDEESDPGRILYELIRTVNAPFKYACAAHYRVQFRPTNLATVKASRDGPNHRPPLHSASAVEAAPLWPGRHINPEMQPRGEKRAWGSACLTAGPTAGRRASSWRGRTRKAGRSRSSPGIPRPPREIFRAEFVRCERPRATSAWMSSHPAGAEDRPTTSGRGVESHMRAIG